MDPLSITTAVISLTATSVRIARALHHLREKFKYAQLTISAIATESTVVSASLTRVQSLVLHDSEGISGQLQSRSDLSNIFDCALTGCNVVLTVLDEELQKLVLATATGDVSFTTKCKYIWNEPTMVDLLQQLRGQHSALQLLLQAIQMESVADLSKLMRNNNEVLQQVAERTRSLRQNYASARGPKSKSIFDSDDVVSIYSEASTVSQTEFDFDNLIVNSTVYRRAFAGAYLRKPRRLNDDDDDDKSMSSTTVDSDDGSEEDDATIREETFDVDPSWSERTVTGSPHPVRARLSGNSYTRALRWRLEEAEAKLAALQKPSTAQTLGDVQRSESAASTLVEGDRPLSPDHHLSPTTDYEDIAKEYEVLKEKYRKVKRFYFEGVEQAQSSEKAKAGLEERIRAKEAELEDQGLLLGRMSYLMTKELAEPPATEADSDAQSTAGSTATSTRSITYKDHDVLHQKYQKVKRYYFEQQAQIEELKKQSRPRGVPDTSDMPTYASHHQELKKQGTPRGFLDTSDMPTYYSYSEEELKKQGRPRRVLDTSDMPTYASHHKEVRLSEKPPTTPAGELDSDLVWDWAIGGWKRKPRVVPV